MSPRSRTLAHPRLSDRRPTLPLALADTSPKMKLRCVGFCGADDSVEPELLAAISAKHDWVEWGVLFRHDKEGEPRYASSAWLKRLAAVNSSRSMQLAGHLCSQRVDELLRGDASFVRYLHAELGFARVQINATAANNCNVAAFGSDAGAAKCVAALREAFAAVPEVEFIMQRNRETKALWERLLEEPPSNMSMLFDDSMGLGVAATSWPPPPTLEALKFGYAGGLSPANLVQQLDSMESVAAGRTLWVDMETSLRTKLKDDSDIFDANKVMRCVTAVIQSGRTPQA